MAFHNKAGENLWIPDWSNHNGDNEDNAYLRDTEEVKLIEWCESKRGYRES